MALAATALLAFAIRPAAAFDRSAPSSVSIIRHGEELTFVTTTSRLLPFVIRDRRTNQYRTRLVTVRTTVKSRTDLDGVTGRVAVTVDDLDRRAPRQLASWSDAGLDGTLLDAADPPLFVTAATGCCGVVHLARVVDTGRILFRSTGDGPAGVSAWFNLAGVPFDNRRWAALEADYGYTHRDLHSAAILRYGDRGGTIQTLEVRVGPEPDAAVDFARRVASADALLWDNGTDAKERPGLQVSTAEVPALVGIGQKPAGRGDIGGFSLVIRIPPSRDGSAPAQVLARIPLRGDRLHPEDATMAPGVSLVDVPAGDR